MPALLLLVVPLSQAADRTITTGQTVGQQILNAGDTLTIEPGGTIRDTSSAVLHNTAGNVPALSNHGTITGGHDGVLAWNIGSLTNSGTITGGTSDGIDALEIGSLTNSGTITGGTSDGIDIFDIGSLTNHGTITGGADGVVVRDIGSLTNHGTITGGDDGVVASDNIGSLTNSGTITGGAGDGVVVRDIGSLTNSGTITGGANGVVASDNIGSLTNSGTITGGADGIDALDIGSLTNSGTITGARYGVVASDNIGSLTNSGTITSSRDGIYAREIGSLTNSGMITGDDHGILASDNIGSLTNSGTITGDDDGIHAREIIGSLTNHGTITSGRHGIYAQEIGSLTNSGTITGGRYYGVWGDGEIGSLTNHGTITGSDDGVLATTIGSLTNSGTITGTSDDGVSATTIGSLTNHGTITGSDDGVLATTIGSLTNHGTITGSDDGVSATTIGSLTNHGTITGSDDGVSATTIGSLTNSGTITGSDDGVSATTIGSLTNSGTITGSDDGVSATTIGRLTNHGTITGSDDGINMDFGTVVNTGLIQGRTGIEVDRDTAGNAFITNAGTIRSTLGPSGTAIDFQGTGDDVLTVERASKIIGAINFGAGRDTLRVEPGYSTVFTVDSTPEVLVSTNGPVFTTSTQVAVLNTTGFAQVDDVAAQLTSSVAGAVSRQASRSMAPELAARAAAPRVRIGRLASAGSLQGLSARPAPPPRYRAWLEGVGGMVQRRTDGATLSAKSYWGGGLLGLDRVTTKKQRLGGFVGGAAHKSKIDLGQTLAVTSYYGGVYVGYRWSAYRLDHSLTVGTLHFDNRRKVANNMAPSGVETARGDYTGLFVNPQSTVARLMPLTAHYTLEPSWRLGYIGVWTEGYQERGTLANARVKARALHIVTTRAKLGLHVHNEPGRPDTWDLEFYAGGAGRLHVGQNTVRAQLLGQSRTFHAGGEDQVLNGFGGLAVSSQDSSNALALHAGLEMGGGTDSSWYMTGQARILYRF